MRRVVLDTSSIISLSMIGLMTKCLQIFEIIVPKAVARELEDASAYKDDVGKAARSALKLMKEKKIAVYLVDKGKVERLLSSDVGIGEAECVVCCMKNKINLLVMDDTDALYSLEDVALAKGIETNISIWLIAELTNNRIITKREAVSYIKNLVRLREWEGGVLEVLSKRYLEGLLK